MRDRETFVKAPSQLNILRSGELLSSTRQIRDCAGTRALNVYSFIITSRFCFRLSPSFAFMTQSRVQQCRSRFLLPRFHGEVDRLLPSLQCAFICERRALNSLQEEREQKIFSLRGRRARYARWRRARTVVERADCPAVQVL